MFKKIWPLTTMSVLLITPLTLVISCATPPNDPPAGNQTPEENEDAKKAKEKQEKEALAQSYVDQLKAIRVIQGWQDLSPMWINDSSQIDDLKDLNQKNDNINRGLELEIPEAILNSVKDVSWNYQVDPLTKEIREEDWEIIYIDRETKKVIDEVKWQEDNPSGKIADHIYNSETNPEGNFDRKFSWPIIISGKVELEGFYDTYTVSFNDWKLKGFSSEELNLADWKIKYGNEIKHALFDSTYNYDLTDEERVQVDNYFFKYSILDSKNAPFWHVISNDNFKWANDKTNILAFEIKENSMYDTLPFNFRYPITSSDYESLYIYNSKLKGKKLPPNFYYPANINSFFNENSLASGMIYAEDFYIPANMVFSLKFFSDTTLTQGFTIAKDAMILEADSSWSIDESAFFSDINDWIFPANSHWEVLDDDGNLIRNIDDVTMINDQEVGVLSDKSENLVVPDKGWLESVYGYTFTNTIRLIDEDYVAAN